MRSDKDETSRRMEDPQPGDRFQEMLSFWVKVVSRHEGLVIYQERSDDDWSQPRADSLEEFQARFGYRTIPGYWIRFVDTPGDVSHVPVVGVELEAWLGPILADREERITRPAMDSAIL